MRQICYVLSEKMQDSVYYVIPNVCIHTSTHVYKLCL